MQRWLWRAQSVHASLKRRPSSLWGQMHLNQQKPPGNRVDHFQESEGGHCPLRQSYHSSVAPNEESGLVARDGRRWGPTNGRARVSSPL